MSQEESFTEVKRRQGPRGQKRQAKENQLKSTYIKHEKKPEVMTVKHTEENNKQNFKELQIELKNLKKRNHSPKVDLVEDNNFYIITMELPGISENNIIIELLESQIILVKAFKYQEPFPENYNIIYNECKYGESIRRVKVKNIVNKESIAATTFNGILRIVLEKLQPVSISKIEIKPIKKQEISVQNVNVPEEIKNESEIEDQLKVEKISWADII
jgi:HSP20 family molecular chaperone IbpA